MSYKHSLIKYLGINKFYLGGETGQLESRIITVAGTIRTCCGKSGSAPKSLTGSSLQQVRSKSV